jgi:hypothetical protein
MGLRSRVALLFAHGGAGYAANMTSERDPIERDIEREEAAAAEEAGKIGGRSGFEDLPEEERPLAESGEGESEGFEQAEELLEERASHEDDRGSPLRDRPEPEPDRQRTSHGEPDRVDSTETEADEP